jgi:hypothetical protein
MQPFRHYLTTRFNVGIYARGARLRIPPAQWMEHRWKLFAMITLPSIMEQTCQDFTWLVLMDKETPEAYIREIESFRCPNLKVIFPTTVKPHWLQAFEPGDYALITTRVDNDDALHRRTIETIQDAYRVENPYRPLPWTIVFPFGLILDLAKRDIWVMEYWFNNCPTLVENSGTAKTIWQWDHSNIPPQIQRCYVRDQPYWLQVVHSQNVLNEIPTTPSMKILHRDILVPLEKLTEFSIHPDSLPVA